MDRESQAGIPVTHADSGFLCPSVQETEERMGTET